MEIAYYFSKVATIECSRCPPEKKNGMWRVKVPLGAQNLGESTELDENPSEMDDKTWNKMNHTGALRSCLTKEIKYQSESLA